MICYLDIYFLTYSIILHGWLSVSGGGDNKLYYFYTILWKSLSFYEAEFDIFWLGWCHFAVNSSIIFLIFVNRYSQNRHGTRCAAQVAAEANNSFCIVGVAYNARIGGLTQSFSHVLVLYKKQIFTKHMSEIMQTVRSITKQNHLKQL